MIENTGNIDPNRLYELLVDDITPKPDAAGKGLAASRKGGLPPARSDAHAPPAGPLLHAPTSGIPAHQYYAALDAASPRFTAAASALDPNAAGSGGARSGAFVAIYMSPEQGMARAENLALLFNFRALIDYFQTREQAIKANASEAKSLAQNFWDAADKIASHAGRAFYEALAGAALTAAVAINSFANSGPSDAAEGAGSLVAVERVTSEGYK